MSAKDWSGYQYDFLTLTRPSEQKAKHGKSRKWYATCRCGKEVLIDPQDLVKAERRGTRRSCGCMKTAWISERMKTHGMTKHPAYGVWHSMVQRCTEPTHRAWKNYGGRGITVCERWRNSFENFWQDMGPSYQPGLDIDRINNDLGYSPENCRWTTRRENCLNKRGTRTVALSGQEIPVRKLSESSGIKYSTLLYRLDHGCPLSRLLEEPNTTRQFLT